MKKLLLFALSLSATMSTQAQRRVTTDGNKNTLLEYSVSVANGFSPDADYVAMRMRDTIPGLISVAMHYGATDSMASDDASDYVNYYLTGSPKGTIDRVPRTGSFAEESRENWSAFASQRMLVAPTFDLTMIHTYDTATRNISVTLSGTALTALSGAYHFNVYVVEDSVIGTGSGYNQANNYNAITGHPFFGAGNPIPGYNHMQVCRVMLGGVMGQFAITSPSANSVSTGIFNYTLPPTYNEKHIRLIGVVLKSDNNVNLCAVHNSVEARLTACVTPKVQLCAVSYDETSGRNIVYWNKAGVENAMTYHIHKSSNTSTGFQMFGSSSPDSAAMFKDMITNPTVANETYKITVTDSCNRETELDSSIAHKTMLLAITSATGNTVKLGWNLYEGVTFTKQNVLRSVDGGAYQSIAQVAATATTFDDMSAPTGFLSYKIELPDVANCGVSAIYSNNATLSVGIAKVNGNPYGLKLYPNPANDVFTIEGMQTGDKVVLTDVSGRQLQVWSVNGNTSPTFNLSGINAGMYFVNVFDAAGLPKANLKLQHH